MPYTAQRQSLYGSVGAPNAPTTQLDVPGTIDALTGGATSLIHATMLRKQAEFERQRQGAQLALEQRREARETEQQDWDRKFRETEANRKFLTEGGIPAHDEMTPTPITTTVPMPKGPSPIARAMRPSSTEPRPAYTPSAPPAAPTTAPLRASTLTPTHVPEKYDPTKAATYIRTTETARANAEARAEVEGQREANQRAMLDRRLKGNADAAAAAQKGRVEIERMKELAARSRVARPMTANAIAATAAATAEGIIASHGGSYDDAAAWIGSDDPEATKLRSMEKDLPVSWSTYLSNAHAKWTKAATGQVLSLERGTMGLDPEEAKAKVDSTRKLVTKPRTAAKPAAAPAAIAKPPVTAPAAKPPAEPDDLTDAEIDAALDAGKENPEDVKAYVLEQRKKKPAVKKP
jgi:hypothetical protein